MKRNGNGSNKRTKNRNDKAATPADGYAEISNIIDPYVHGGSGLSQLILPPAVRRFLDVVALPDSHTSLLLCFSAAAASVALVAAASLECIS